VRGQNFQQTFKSRLDALGQSSDAERLRLALTGGQVAVFDWTIADDHVAWDGADAVLRRHPEPERLTSGQGLRAWLGPEAQGRLLSFIDEPTPLDSTFTLEFEADLQIDARMVRDLRGAAVGRDGRAERVTGMVRPITEQKHTLIRLNYLASCDELTGHLNRTRLREELTRVIARATVESALAHILSLPSISLRSSTRPTALIPPTK